MRTFKIIAIVHLISVFPFSMFFSDFLKLKKNLEKIFREGGRRGRDRVHCILNFLFFLVFVLYNKE